MLFAHGIAALAYNCGVLCLFIYLLFEKVKTFPKVWICIFLHSLEKFFGEEASRNLAPVEGLNTIIINGIS
jgi:hypothetical protein